MQVVMGPPACTMHRPVPSLCDSAGWHAWHAPRAQAPQSHRRQSTAASTADRRRSRREVACAAEPQQLTRSADDVSYDDLADSIGVQSPPACLS